MLVSYANPNIQSVCVNWVMWLQVSHQIERVPFAARNQREKNLAASQYDIRTSFSCELTHRSFSSFLYVCLGLNSWHHFKVQLIRLQKVHGWLIEQGLMSHQTHYGSYWGRVFKGQMTQWSDQSEQDQGNIRSTNTTYPPNARETGATQTSDFMSFLSSRQNRKIWKSNWLTKQGLTSHQTHYSLQVILGTGFYGSNDPIDWARFNIPSNTL